MYSLHDLRVLLIGLAVVAVLLWWVHRGRHGPPV